MDLFAVGCIRAMRKPRFVQEKIDISNGCPYTLASLSNASSPRNVIEHAPTVKKDFTKDCSLPNETVFVFLFFL
jgi:hypothetical protein